MRSVADLRPRSGRLQGSSRDRKVRASGLPVLARTNRIRRARDGLRRSRRRSSADGPAAAQPCRAPAALDAGRGAYAPRSRRRLDLACALRPPRPAVAREAREDDPGRRATRPRRPAAQAAVRVGHRGRGRRNPGHRRAADPCDQRGARREQEPDRRVGGSGRIHGVRLEVDLFRGDTDLFDEMRESGRWTSASSLSGAGGRVSAVVISIRYERQRPSHGSSRAW